MNVAYRHPGRESAVEITGSQRGMRLSRVDIVDNLAGAEAVWRGLLQQGALATPFQHYDWVALWQKHVGEPAGLTPIIAIGYDGAEQPIFLWPLVRSREGRLTVARFFGGKHANFNMPLWRRDTASDLTAADLQQVLRALADRGIDLAAFSYQPQTWDRVRNPLTLLAHQPSTDNSYSLVLDSPTDDPVARQFNPDSRRKLRRKERHLAALPGYRHVRARTPEEVNRYIDAFYAQKSARLAARGINNAFAEPGVDAFLRAACLHGLAEGRPLIEIHVLDTDSELLALFSAIHDDRYFTTMFNSYTLSQHARMSPGLLLLINLVKDCASRGFSQFSLGPGSADYKTSLCNTVEPLFDSFLPLSARGWVAAFVMRRTYRLRRWVKNTPAAWTFAQSLRRTLSFGRR